MSTTTMIFSLHTARPGDVGERPANEISYPGYGRVRFMRTDHGWAPADRRRSRATAHDTVVSFPQCRAGGGEARFWAACSTDDEIRLVGTLFPSITVSPGITPEVHLAALDEIVRAAEVAQRGVVSHVDREALQSIRDVVANAVGHPGRDAALRAIDRLTGHGQT